MKLTRNVRMAAIGASVLMLAGAASAQQPYVETYVHGNACTGAGAVPTAWGAYNPSTTAAVTVTCPVASAWPMFPGGQQRWMQITYYNRNTTPGAFTCKAYGLSDDGGLVWSPPTVTIPAGAPGGPSGQITVGVPPLNAKFFSVTCTIPKAVGAGNPFSYLSSIALKIGS